jgi:ribA/ribD-fused uncharacterized protein
MEQFEFFWSGPLSQWHMAKFKVNGMDFNCAEQFMMFCKAVFFEDMKIANEIMHSNNPKEQKSLGHKVNNFITDKWEKVARDIVYVGNMCKFTQNEKEQNILMATNGKTLVEASPYDTVWGIGLSSDDPLVKQRETWRGRNWLGEVLTRVRNDLRFNEPIIINNFNFADSLIKNYRRWVVKEKNKNQMDVIGNH